MRFFILSRDKENSLPMRQKNRDAHLAFLNAQSAVDVQTAGPWLNAAGDMAGSLLIVDAPDLDTVQDWLSRDPYAKAGLSQSVEIKPFIWAIGAP